MAYYTCSEVICFPCKVGSASNNDMHNILPILLDKTAPGGSCEDICVGFDWYLIC